jgi:hypothetical protein
VTTPDQGTGGAGAAPPDLVDLYAAHAAACSLWALFATRAHARTLDEVTCRLRVAIDQTPTSERYSRHAALDMVHADAATRAMRTAVVRALPVPDEQDALEVLRSLEDAGFDITYTPKPGG